MIFYLVVQYDHPFFCINVFFLGGNKIVGLGSMYLCLRKWKLRNLIVGENQS